MNSHQVSVVLHVRDAFEPTNRQELERTLARQAGVRQTRPSPRAPRLLLVDYDPSATSASRILDAVRSRGISARLIGL